MIAITLVKVTVLLVLAWLLAHALRSASAAVRHFVWSAALFGCVAISAIATIAPPLKVPLPVQAQVAAPAVTTEPVERQPLRPPVTATSENIDGRSGRRSTVPVWSLVWLAGFLGVAVWSVIGHVVLARVAKRATRADGYRVSDEIGAPVTCGWIEPVILLPRESTGWPEERRRAALLHELAHVARADFLTQTLARLVAAVYWFHPLVWVALRRMRAESEHACDDRVLREGMPASEYATHLLDVAHGAITRRHGALAAVAMARPSQLESRLVAVLDERRSRRFPSRRAVVSAAIVIAVVLLPFAAARPELRASTPARVVRQPLNVLTEPIQEVRNAVRSIHLKKKDDGPSHTMDHSIEAVPGETLTFNLRTGASIDIRGWDEPRVEVHSILGGRDGADSRIEVERAADGVQIATIYEGSNDSYSTSIKLEIRAPRRINVDLESSGGSVTLADLEGAFRGSTGGGEIDLQHLKGSADLSTGGGNIFVADSDLRGSVSTGGGSVKLERVRGGLRGSSGSGPVTYRRDERLHIERAGGHVNLEEAPDGASITTGGGDIEVGRAAGLVEASTGGGDVRVGPVAGSVQAGTGAGDVEITIDEANGIEQTVHATTGSGRVIINLPAGFDGRFDLETAYTRDETHIESDWNLDREPATDWDDSEGTPRRYVRARGTAGSGRGSVKVKAVNGDVIVRKR